MKTKLLIFTTLAAIAIYFIFKIRSAKGLKMSLSSIRPNIDGSLYFEMKVFNPGILPIGFLSFEGNLKNSQNINTATVTISEPFNIQPKNFATLKGTISEIRAGAVNFKNMKLVGRAEIAKGLKIPLISSI